MPNLTDRDDELLSAYLDGALSPDERRTLEARLEIEPDLRRELAVLRQTVALIRALPPLQAPRNFTLTRDMVRPPRVLIFPATTLVSTFSAVAAIILVAAGVLLLSLKSNTSLAPQAAGVANMDQVAQAPSVQMEADDESPIAQTQVSLFAATERLESTTLAADDTNDPQAQRAQLTATARNDTVDSAVEIAAEEVQGSLPTGSVFEPSATLPDAMPAPAMPPASGNDAFSGGEAAPVEAQTFEGEVAESTVILAPTLVQPGDGVIADLAIPAPVQATFAAAPESAAAGAAQIAATPSPAETMLTRATTSPTMSPSPTVTASPTPQPTATVTITFTASPSPTLVSTATSQPTATPVPRQTTSPITLDPGVLGVILVVMGIMAFGLFAMTLAARRSR